MSISRLQVAAATVWFAALLITVGVLIAFGATPPPLVATFAWLLASGVPLAIVWLIFTGAPPPIIGQVLYDAERAPDLLGTRLGRRSDSLASSRREERT